MQTNNQQEPLYRFVKASVKEPPLKKAVHYIINGQLGPTEVTLQYLGNDVYYNPFNKTEYGFPREIVEYLEQIPPPKQEETPADKRELLADMILEYHAQPIYGWNKPDILEWLESAKARSLISQLFQQEG